MLYHTVNCQDQHQDPMAITYQVVFVSTPGIGNLVPTVEFAQYLVNRDRRFRATILIITLPERPTVNTYIESRAALAADDGHIKFIHLPTVDRPTPDQYQLSVAFLSLYIEKHRLHVKHALTDLMSADSVPLVALFIDMFSTPFIDVANDLSLPCYLYFASPATFLGFLLHMPVLDGEITTDLCDSEAELSIPCFANPVPPPVLPTSVLKRNLDGYTWLLRHGQRFRETKGIVVNTFQKLEPLALESLRKPDIPPVYPVGPIIDLNGPAQWLPDRAQHETIMKWLDNQPAASVVFLCFGSQGSLGPAQIREIAQGLERAGFRFVWSVREPAKGKVELPGDYANVAEILPEGFIDRTGEMGVVCGMAPQVRILRHGAIGGFVSHCGWNSVLESLWYGVPIATWPIYAEQQMNAFEMVKELGMAVEIRLDYREGSEMVTGEELETGIRTLMSGHSQVRRKVWKMKKTARMGLLDNGSASLSLERLINDIVDTNTPRAKW